MTDLSSDLILRVNFVTLYLVRIVSDVLGYEAWEGPSS